MKLAYTQFALLIVCNMQKTCCMYIVCNLTCFVCDRMLTGSDCGPEDLGIAFVFLKLLNTFNLIALTYTEKYFSQVYTSIESADICAEEQLRVVYCWF